MNYYKQGDAANADQIKAAFEKLGYEKVNVIHIGDYANERLFFFTENGKVRSTLKDCGIVHIIKTHPGYKELELPVKPNFKVGDWITDGACKVKITDINNTNYWYSKNCILGEIESIDKKYHLWTIADAKDGDVLVDEYTDTIGIFEEINGIYWRSKIYCAESTYTKVYHHGGSHHIKLTKPATKEQRDLLFKKMKEVGYQWDDDKKELRKIQPHYMTLQEIDEMAITVPYCFENEREEQWYKVGLREGADAAIEQLGWHPANELPVIPKGEDKVEVYCLVHGKGLTILVPMKLHYTVSRGFGVSENIEIKWWCYPPKED